MTPEVEALLAELVYRLRALDEKLERVAGCPEDLPDIVQDVRREIQELSDQIDDLVTYHIYSI